MNKSDSVSNSVIGEERKDLQSSPNKEKHVSAPAHGGIGDGKGQDRDAPLNEIDSAPNLVVCGDVPAPAPTVVVDEVDNPALSASSSSASSSSSSAHVSSSHSKAASSSNAIHSTSSAYASTVSSSSASSSSSNASSHSGKVSPTMPMEQSKEIPFPHDSAVVVPQLQENMQEVHFAGNLTPLQDKPLHIKGACIYVPRDEQNVVTSLSLGDELLSNEPFSGDNSTLHVAMGDESVLP